MQTVKQYAPEVIFYAERALRRMPTPSRLPHRPDLPTQRQEVEEYVGKLLSTPEQINRDVEELKELEEFLSPTDARQSMFALTREEQRVCNMATD